MHTSKMLSTITHLIHKGLNANHIQQVLKLEGHKVYCFGSYYTVGKTAKTRVCFYVTDSGVKAQLVNQ